MINRFSIFFTISTFFLMSTTNTWCHKQKCEVLWCVYISGKCSDENSSKCRQSCTRHWRFFWTFKSNIVAKQSVTKIIALIFANLVTPKAWQQTSGLFGWLLQWMLSFHCWLPKEPRYFRTIGFSMRLGITQGVCSSLLTHSLFRGLYHKTYYDHNLQSP